MGGISSRVLWGPGNCDGIIFNRLLWYLEGKKEKEKKKLKKY